MTETWGEFTRAWNQPETEAALRERLLEQASPYVTDGSPRLRTSLVAYFDVLGTKDLSSSLDDEVLGRYLRLLEGLRWRLGPQSQSKVLTFSDNIAIATPVNRAAFNDGGLQWMALGIGQYQCQLALAGYFMRGGIAVGPAYADLSIIIGSALVEAVRLEEQIAKNPRILLGPSYLRHFDESPHALHKDLWLPDDDGQLYLNYLEASAQDKSSELTRSELLIRHRDALVAAKRGAGPEVQSKLAWTVAYHDRVAILWDEPSIILE